MKHSALCAAGQSLSEYALVGGVIVVVVIGSVILMGNHANENLTQTNQQLFGNNADGKVNKISGLLDSNNAQNLTTLSITLADGATVTLENYPSNLKNSIETVGTNGTTDLLVGNLKTFAQKLRDQGKISEDQFNKMSALANQGHRIARVEKSLEIAARNAKGSGAVFLSSPIDVDGVEYKEPALLIQRINLDDVPERDMPELVNYIQSKGFEIPSTEKSVGADLAQFYQLYKDLDESGALSDPATNKVVTTLASQIQLIADQSSNTIVGLLNTGKDPAEVSLHVANLVTHQNSKGICSTGGTQDTGVHCPK